MNLFKFIFIIFTIENFAQAEFTKIRPTTGGPVQGNVLKTALRHVEYSSFRGIPYAKPPIDSLRFQPPLEPDNRTSLFLALNDPTNCAQYSMEHMTVIGSEDCLYLNVYTPEVNFDTHYPLRAVMVWIHGGAFLWGSNNSTKFGPDFLLEKDVVIVAMNYRLGPFGFLTLNDYAYGNMGLKDQVLALEWVKKNIAYFGGDPNKVTIFGESAGAVAVELHRLSPLSRGLFRASIAMSGSPKNQWAYYDDNSEAVQKTSKGLIAGFSDVWGIGTEEYLIPQVPMIFTDIFMNPLFDATRNIFEDEPTRKEAYMFIKNCSTYDLAKMAHQLTWERHNIIFRPTKESGFSKHPFINYTVDETYKSGKASNTPHILGLTNDETIYGVKSPAGFERIVEAVVAPIELMFTSHFFEAGIEDTRKLLIRYTNATVYYYRNYFDYDKAIHKVEGSTIGGVAHADDIAHIFYVKDKQQSLDINSDIGKHREKMVTWWTNFAKYLNPTPHGQKVDGIIWQPTGKKGYILNIDQESNLNYVKNIMQEADETIGDFIGETIGSWMPNDDDEDDDDDNDDDDDE